MSLTSLKIHLKLRKMASLSKMMYIVLKMRYIENYREDLKTINLTLTFNSQFKITSSFCIYAYIHTYA